MAGSKVARFDAILADSLSAKPDRVGCVAHWKKPRGILYRGETATK